MPTMLEYALEYHKLGWPIIPINNNPERGKVPLIKWIDFQNRRPSEEEIHSWWKRNPNANIGLVTGAISGIIVIDLDSAEGQEAYRPKFGEIHGTISQKTGKPGGKHLLFAHPLDGKRYQNSTQTLKDVDVRGDGGYIVLAPSVHPNGTIYQWEIDPLECGLADLMALPKELKELFPGDKPAPAPSAPAFQKSDPERDDMQSLMFGVGEPGRNSALTKLAGYWLRQYGGDVEKVLELAQEWNRSNRPPLDWKEVDKDRSVYRQDPHPQYAQG